MNINEKDKIKFNKLHIGTHYFLFLAGFFLGMASLFFIIDLIILKQLTYYSFCGTLCCMGMFGSLQYRDHLATKLTKLVEEIKNK